MFITLMAYNAKLKKYALLPIKRNNIANNITYRNFRTHLISFLAVYSSKNNLLLQNFNVL